MITYPVPIKELNNILNLPFNSGTHTRPYNFSDSNISSRSQENINYLISHPPLTGFTLISFLFFQTSWL